jgi:hypothetical protein
MAYSDEALFDVFEKTDGECHICCGEEGRLIFSNYANYGARGAWEVSHHKAIACGGSDAFSNKYAAHIRCNRRSGAECKVPPRHRHNHTNAFCCSDCRGNRFARDHRERDSGEQEPCAARLAIDGRMRCQNSSRRGSRFCGLHAGWRRGSF